MRSGVFSQVVVEPASLWNSHWFEEMYGRLLNRLDNSETFCLTTLSATDTVTSNEWMAVGKEVESTWKWLWLVARFFPCHVLERLDKTQNSLIYDSRCRGRGLNWAELELKKKKLNISLIMPCRHTGERRYSCTHL